MLIAEEKHCKILEEVVSLPTAPFYEDKIIEYIQKFAEKHHLNLTQDPYGNQRIEYKNSQYCIPLGFMAHMDHPGFVIESMEGEYLKLRGLGGVVEPRKGSKLNLFADNKETLVSVVSIQKEEIDSSPLYILVEGYKPDIMQGFAMYSLEPYRLDQNIVYGRAMDDLAGCAALLALLSIVAEQKPEVNLHIFFSRAEETGFIGASAMALNHCLPKDLPIITLEASKEIANAIQGQGVVVRLGDRSGMFDGETTAFLLQVARQLSMEEKKFLYQKTILDGGTCESSVLCAFGYPSSGLAVPLGCYHNNGSTGDPECEYIHQQDWMNMVNLLWRLVLQSEQRIAWKETIKEGFIQKYKKFENYKRFLEIKKSFTV